MYFIVLNSSVLFLCFLCFVVFCCYVLFSVVFVVLCRSMLLFLLFCVVLCCYVVVCCFFCVVGPSPRKRTSWQVFQSSIISRKRENAGPGETRLDPAGRIRPDFRLFGCLTVY